MIQRSILVSLWAAVAMIVAMPSSFAQTGAPAADTEAPQGAAPPVDHAPSRATPLPVYRPPLRGAPGGRVGGASRSASVPSEPLPVISLIAPADHTGLTATPKPHLYFFINRAPRWPTEVTIAAPGQPVPVLETTIPPPSRAGIYGVSLARYHVRLRPGIIYTWSVSVVLDPHDWSHNIVASATIMLAPHPAPTSGISAARRVDDLAGEGLWYDAIAAAVADENRDGHAALDALMQQVGLRDAVAYDRRADAPEAARP